MTFEIGLVLAIVVIAAVLFAMETLRIDVVALSALGLLLVTGLVTPEEAISGFSNPAVVTVASMFVLSAGLQKTGTLLALGRVLVDIGRRKLVFLVAMMGVAGFASAFINNTPVVAVMLPVVMAVAARHAVNPSQWLIPLSYASQFGGVCTLIGTSTNILVSSIAADSGLGPFSMFEFSELGLIFFATGVAYMLTIGRHLLPERPARRLAEAYQLGDYITELRVVEGSPLIGKTLSKSEWLSKHEVRPLRVLRDGRPLKGWPRSRLREGDVLLVQGDVKDLVDAKEARGLEINPKFEFQDDTLSDQDTVLVEVLVSPRSRVIGSTLSDLDFLRRYQMIAIAMQRSGQPLHQALDRVRLHAGDALLLQGKPEEVERLIEDEDFIVLEEKKGVHFLRSRSPLAVTIVAAVVLVAAFTPVPIVASALLGAILMVLTRCLRIEDAYDAIDWRVIFLLAGILPLGAAMTDTGAAEWVASQTLWAVGDLGPLAVLAALFLLTAVLTEIMSNNAAAVLLAPIAISTALALDVDPRPFLIAITFAASTAFATPVGYQTNTMIYGPGGYRFSDFMKVGIPLNLVFLVVAIIFIPRIWPF